MLSKFSTDYVLNYKSTSRLIDSSDTLEILHPKSNITKISQYNIELTKMLDQLHIPSFSQKDVAVLDRITFKPIITDLNQNSEESKIGDIDSCVNLGKA